MDNKERLIEVLDSFFHDEKPPREYLVTIADTIAAANLLAPEWISVTDRVPEKNVLSLVLDVLGQVHVDTHPTGKIGGPRDGWWNIGSVTHWQPLPAAPKDNHDD